jgi:hypothetical protein
VDSTHSGKKPWIQNIFHVLAQLYAVAIQLPEIDITEFIGDSKDFRMTGKEWDFSSHWGLHAVDALRAFHGLVFLRNVKE